MSEGLVVVANDAELIERARQGVAEGAAFVSATRIVSMAAVSSGRCQASGSMLARSHTRVLAGRSKRGRRGNRGLRGNRGRGRVRGDIHCSSTIAGRLDRLWRSARR